MYGVLGTDGVVYGPVPVAALFEWIAQGRIVPTTVLIDWQGRHVPASMVPELHGAFPVQAPAHAFAPSVAAYDPLAKRKRTALWLAFVLGPLGAHRFYLGRMGSAIAMLALNLSAFASISNWRVIVLVEVVSTVWLIVDMAMIAGGKLPDASGRPLA